MRLLDLKDHIKGFPDLHIFNYGLSVPFSWRGSYGQVAFSIIDSPTAREEILERIDYAYKNSFFGYKGGEYEFDDHTPVNFEGGGYGSYTDGGYVAEMLAKIEGSDKYESQEDRLVKIAFN